MLFPDSPTALLQDLIRIPSVNPDSAPNQGATGERDCAKLVASLLESCGAEVTLDEVSPGRPNVIGRFPGRSGKPGLLLAPHVDTVSAEGMTVEPYGGEIRDGRVYGRGASDTKGTMAAMLWALFTLRDEIPRLSAGVTFVGLMGEEADQAGSKHFAKNHGQDYQFALVGEPTSLETVHAHKGCAWLQLTASGKSCHGSTPEKGENAIRKLIPVIEALFQHLEHRFPEFADPYLGLPSASLGIINGGSSPNIVASECRAVLDFRETPSLNRHGGCRRLVDDFLSAHCPDAGVTTSLLADSTPLLTDPEEDGVKRLLSIGSRLTTAPWYCDAGRLAEVGIPSVACGPGNIAQAHTRDEFLSISDLEEGADFYRRFLETYR